MKEKENISPEFLETIERYYNGLMSKEEKFAFEEALQQNALLEQEVEDIKTLLFSIEKQSLKEKIDEFHADLPIQLEIEPSISNLRFLNFRNIAAVVILFAVGSFWFFNASSNEKIYDNYFKPDPGLPTMMATSDDYTFYDAMVNYKQGDYKTAISKWEKLEKLSPNNDTLIYFLGVAHLADKHIDKALSYLEKSSETTTSVFVEDAYYYLALVYLKKDKRDKAIEFLKKSTSEDSKKLPEQLK